MNSLTARGAGVLLTSVFLATPALADDPSVSLTLAEPIFEIGNTIELTLTGPPGALTFVAFAARRDTIVLPGIGTFGIAFDPFPSYIYLGPLPASGKRKLKDATLCSRIDFADQPFFVQAAMFVAPNFTPACITEVGAVIAANGECPRCVDEPVADASLTNLAGGVALSLFGADFTVESASSLAEQTDGTAVLELVLRSTTDPDAGFIADLSWSGRLDCIDAGFPPASAPNLKLLPNAYFAGGGSIDPDGWHYYTNAAGSLVGFGTYEGAFVQLNEAAPSQFGRGANGRNAAYGLCSAVDATVLGQPDNGPSLADEQGAELVLGEAPCLGNTPICLTGSRVGDHAFYLGDLIGDKEWMFDGAPGEFTEFPDGTATLTGRIVNEDDPELCFDVVGFFSGLVEPGDANYPPTDSPKLGNVGGDDLIENGGTVDINTFHYYTETNILLKGCGDLTGALVQLTRKGPAFQIGVGANWHDVDNGASGWIYWTTLAQPTAGPTLPDSGSGDINLDFVPCPTRVSAPVVHFDFESQAGETVYDRSSGIDMVFEREDGDLTWIQDAGRSGLRFDQGSSIDTCLRRPDGTDNQALLDALVGGQAFTVQVLYRSTTEETNDSRLVSFSSGTSVDDRNFSLMAYPEGDHVEVQQRIATQKGTYDHEFDVDWDAGDLVVYTLSYDGLGDQQVHVYANGERIGRFLYGGDLRTWTLRPFTIGNEHGGNRPFDGELFDVKIWNRPLSADEAAAEAAALLLSN